MKKKKPVEPALKTPGSPPKDGHYYGGEAHPVGFDVRGGKYYLAPCDRDSMAEIMAKISGVHDLLDNVNAYCSKELAHSHARRAKWFSTISTMTGIPLDEVSYNYQDGCVTRKVQTPEPEVDPKLAK
jgi:hypothetical protein